MAPKYKYLWIDGKQISEHRYIMEQRIGRKLFPNEVVHHINGNGLDNRIENLQILTPKEHSQIHNQIYPDKKICVVCGKEFAVTHHRREKMTCSDECWRRLEGLRKAKPINQYDKDGNFIKHWESGMEIQRQTGLSASNIYGCCKHKFRYMYGFRWEYAEVENEVSQRAANQ